MAFELSTSTIGVIIAGVTVVVTVLLWAWNQVETIWDVARDLREQFEGKRIDDGYLYPVIDSIRGHEGDSLYRYVRRYVLFQPTGSIILAIRFDHHRFEKEIWKGRIFRETLGKEGVSLVEARTDESTFRTTVVLEIPTANRNEFNEYIGQIAVYLKALFEEFDVEISRR